MLFIMLYDGFIQNHSKWEFLRQYYDIKHHNTMYFNRHGISLKWVMTYLSVLVTSLIVYLCLILLTSVNDATVLEFGN